MTEAPPSTFVCAVDQTPHASLDDLHKHLRHLKVRQEDYYTTYAPVRDRCTGEPIPFKAPAAEYLKREFLNKVTLKRWLKENPDEGREWALNWLAARKAEKGLAYAPCQAELRSLLAPTVAYYEEQFEGGYASVAAWAGLEARFTTPLPEAAELPCPVIVDNREQKPLFNPDRDPAAQWGTLVCGDYGLPVSHDQQVYIERKSLQDLIGSMSDRKVYHQTTEDSNYERVTRELERAAEVGAYVVMLVEQPLSDCLAYKSLPYLQRALAHVKVTPEHVFHNLRELLQRFPTTFQALFVNGRPEAARAVTRLLAAGEAVKTTDLQLQYDSKRLVLKG